MHLNHAWGGDVFCFFVCFCHIVPLTRLDDRRVLKFSRLEKFSALKLCSQNQEFWAPKTLQIAEFNDPKIIQSKWSISGPSNSSNYIVLGTYFLFSGLNHLKFKTAL